MTCVEDAEEWQLCGTAWPRGTPGAQRAPACSRLRAAAPRDQPRLELWQKGGRRKGFHQTQPHAAHGGLAEGADRDDVAPIVPTSLWQLAQRRAPSLHPQLAPARVQ
jgi:hypothetical protein